MNPNIANATLAFLSRVNLNAEEINAFMAVKQALEAVAEEPVKEPTAATVTELPTAHEMADK